MKKNIKAIVMGIIVLTAFCYSSTMSFKDMNIRKHGKIIKTIISERRSRNFMAWVDVKIDGKKLNAGRVNYENGPKVGDSIEVRYIPGESSVVQTDVTLNGYFLEFALESLLLIFGGYLIIAGFIGEKIPDKKPFEKKKKKKKERRRKSSLID